MLKTMPNVLKANEVRSAGPMQLPLQPGPAQPAGAAPVASGPACVRIAENHPEYALVEVTCSCGKITYIRCDYAPAPA